MIAPNNIYFPMKQARDTDARESFWREREKGEAFTGKYVMDIIREGWKDGDERLQRVILG